MYAGTCVKTSPDFPIPDTMKAWVLGDPGELKLTEKPVPVPKRAEVLVRIDAVAICATDLEIIYHGPPALIQVACRSTRTSRPAMNTWARWRRSAPASTNTDRPARHSGNPRRLRPVQALPRGHVHLVSQYGLNYGDVDKGHRANGFTTDGGFCEYQVNNINTLVPSPTPCRTRRRRSSSPPAPPCTTDRTRRPGGRRKRRRHRAGTDRPAGVAVAKALGAQPVILTGTRDNRLEIGSELGADT